MAHLAVKKLDVDGRLARDLDNLFVAQYIVETKQVLDNGNNFAWKQKPSADSSLQHKLETRLCWASVYGKTKYVPL